MHYPYIWLDTVAKRYTLIDQHNKDPKRATRVVVMELQPIRSTIQAWSNVLPYH